RERHRSMQIDRRRDADQIKWYALQHRAVVTECVRDIKCSGGGFSAFWMTAADGHDLRILNRTKTWDLHLLAEACADNGYANHPAYPRLHCDTAWVIRSNPGLRTSGDVASEPRK